MLHIYIYIYDISRLRVKYNVETLMNDRAEQDDSKQFDLAYQNPCTIIKASFTRSPIKEKRRTRLWHVLVGILDTV